MPDSTRSKGVFNTTHWSVVLAAGKHGSARAAEAMQQLCRAYWYPLYAYIRRRGNNPHDAQDLTQEFFAQLLQRDDLASMQREKGRFRSFLLASLQHFLTNEWKKANRLKRGGGKTIVSMDQVDGEHRYAAEPAHDLSPDKLFERRWAMTLLDRAINRLRNEHATANKLEIFDRLKGLLTGIESGPTYAELGAQFGLTENAVKMAVSRLRRRYRDILRAEIAHTVACADDIEDEIRHLFAALG